MASNTMMVEETSKVAKKVVHIDPKITRTFAVHYFEERIKEADLECFKPDLYAQMSVQETKAGFLIKNPPFGSDIILMAQPERELGGFSNGLENECLVKCYKLEPAVNEFNQQLEECMINIQLKNGNQDVDHYNALLEKAHLIFIRLNSLSFSLLNILDLKNTGFFKTTFKTGGYQIKYKAKEIIENFRETLLSLNQNPDDLVFYHNRLIQTLKTDLENIASEKGTLVINRLLLEIEEKAHLVMNNAENPNCEFTTS